MIRQERGKLTWLADEPLPMSGVVGRFAHRLRQMAKVRGWRKRDNLVLFATIVVLLVASPLRFALLLARPLLAIAGLGNNWARWQRWLSSVDRTVLFDCVVKSRNGLLKLRAHNPDLFYAFGDSEKSVREVFVAEEGEIVVDVGAYIGSYTIRASRLVGNTGKVIAIEAEPSNFDALLFNLRLNQADNVIPLNLAAWDKETVLDLRISKHSAAHSLVWAYLPKDSSQSIKVKARHLDQILENLGIEEVDWVKMDVEGAEVELLRGMEKIISKSPNLKILIEAHMDETKEECLPILRKNGFEFRLLDYFHVFAYPIVSLEGTTGNNG